jgi:hypothetical protein
VRLSSFQNRQKHRFGDRTGGLAPADSIGLAADGFGGRSVTNCGSNPVEATFMRQNSFGKLPSVSALTLGGGGIGMVLG